MDMQNQEGISFLETESSEKAAEYLRLVLTMLREHHLPATPVYYCLLYTYVAGKDSLLNEKLDALLKQGSLTPEMATDLFARFFFKDNDPLLGTIRNELMEKVSEVITSLVTIADKTALTKGQMKKHIKALSRSKTSSDIMTTVSSIISETQQLVTRSKQLETNLLNSSNDLKEMQSELAIARVEAETDVLTGLHNRRGFEQRLKKLVEDRRHTDGGFSLIIADMDHFKKVNDNYGHIVGDKLLAAFGKLLNSKTRSTDYAARYGGEEFVILLPNTSLDNAYIVAENIRKSVEKLRITLAKTGKTISSITTSLGVATHRMGESATDTLDRADKALYRAKDAGRNTSRKAQ